MKKKLNSTKMISKTSKKEKNITRARYPGILLPKVSSSKNKTRMRRDSCYNNKYLTLITI